MYDRSYRTVHDSYPMVPLSSLMRTYLTPSRKVAWNRQRRHYCPQSRICAGKLWGAIWCITLRSSLNSTLCTFYTQSHICLLYRLNIWVLCTQGCSTLLWHSFTSLDGSRHPSAHRRRDRHYPTPERWLTSMRHAALCFRTVLLLQEIFMFIIYCLIYISKTRSIPLNTDTHPG